MAARFEGRVGIEWQITEPLPAIEVPSMIAQPLLENAFKHGVEPHSGITHLTVRMWRPTPDRLQLDIAQDRGHCAAGCAHGQGLANVRHRLAAHYGEAARLEITPRQPEGVCATLHLPCAS